MNALTGVRTRIFNGLDGKQHKIPYGKKVISFSMESDFFSTTEMKNGQKVNSISIDMVLNCENLPEILDHRSNLTA